MFENFQVTKNLNQTQCSSFRTFTKKSVYWKDIIILSNKKRPSNIEIKP